jgi:hypothetical protein
MTQSSIRSTGPRVSIHARVWPSILAVVLLPLAAGCAGSAASSPKPSTTVSDSDYGRLSAGQTRPVDEARSQLALARDELGRAKLAVVNDNQEGALARSDQTSASADATRAAAQTKLGAESNEPAQMQQARDDTSAAKQAKTTADARLAYAAKLAKSQAAVVTAAERKVDLMTEKVNLAKLQSLDDASVAAAGKYDRASTMERVVNAQRAWDQSVAVAAAAALETETAKDAWQGRK